MIESSLFDTPIQLSPRLAWLKNHNVRTHEWKNDPSDRRTFSHLGFGNWVAYVGRFPGHEDEGCYAEGSTEDEALVNLAKGMKWKLWNEESATNKPLNSTP